MGTALSDLLLHGGVIQRSTDAVLENQIVLLKGKLMKLRANRIKMMDDVPDLVVNIQAREYELAKRAGAKKVEKETMREIFTLQKMENEIKQKRLALKYTYLSL
jgi:hypothetical protein